ncbi:MAG: DsbA family protein [Myxococcota bacterium]|nr:DsbA family oxidoreductase [Myxococcota bacterium]
MRIDFVSDVVCPWCAVGLWGLQEAIRRTGIDVELHMQPFELNPDMPPGGEDVAEHLGMKYGRSLLELAKTHEMIGARGAAVGFTFDWQKRDRIYNTFDAHRLIYWAAIEGRDVALARAMMRAYHSEGKDISDHTVLVSIAGEINFDEHGARAVLASDAYGDIVRQTEQQWTELEVAGVPTVIIDGKHVLSGAQPSPVYEAALRQLKG